MEKLGKEIVDKCGGLPLAIVVLSGLLLHNRSYEYWSEVKEHIWRHLKQGGSSQINEILSLSYNDLSLQMRDCFLYLARYPEDHVIDATELKLLWMAEEFISEDDEEDGVVMDDLAEDCLNELINRNLIKIDKFQYDRLSLACCVHDLVRDLAIKKAEELKLVIFDSSKHHHNQIHMLEGQSRHVIYNGIGEYLNFSDRAFDALYLHSLALNNYIGKVELREMKLMYTRFKNLKVLEMTSVETDEIPEEIGDLVLLKYLGLMGATREMDYRKPIAIPASIGKLKKLQTLRGSNHFTGYILPKEICELCELRYLDLIIGGSLNIGSHQTNLHTLRCIGFKAWVKIDTTVNFTNLHMLYIVAEEQEEGNGYTLESIANLTSLQTLGLVMDISTMKPMSSCNRLKTVILLGSIKNASELSYLPHSVTDLTLKDSKFTEDPTPALGNILNLTALELSRVYGGNKMVCSGNAFPLQSNQPVVHIC